MFSSKPFYCCGVMSGSSLDGVDLCLTEFKFEDERAWKFKVIQSTTIAIPNKLKANLNNSDQLEESDLKDLDQSFGEFLGQSIRNFLERKDIPVTVVGVHGHTVFHEPRKKISLQLGNGQIVANQCKIPVVTNFRMADILNGGQGAPLVPFGELKLFNGYDAYLNLGGIANITLPNDKLAYDITYANRALNHVSNWLNIPFDDGGKIAREGSCIKPLLESLNEIKYLTFLPPKSLNNQDFYSEYLPLLNKYPNTPKDVLHTYSVFLAHQISLSFQNKKRCLVTGGGAFNSFLIDKLASNTKTKIDLPSKQIIEMKEALIFAFLALFRLYNRPNILSCFSGAKKDSMGGDLFFPQPQ